MSLDGAEAWGPTYKERDSVVDRISYESGYHTTTSEVVPKIEEGNLKAHVWNNGVSDRISANVLAIDSVYPVFNWALEHSNPADPLTDELDYPLHEKKDVLAWLPVKDREVLVVGGDIKFNLPAVDFTASIPDGAKKSELVARANTRNQEELKGYLPKIIAENATAGLAGFLTAALLFELGQNESRKIEIGNPDSPKHMSRRKFLKLGAAVAGAGTALYVGGRAAAGTLMPFAPNERVHDIGEKILEITSQPELFEQNWIDGRTALLIEKCDSALRQGLTPPDAKGAVVIGNAHALEAGNLMRNAESRRKVIHELASDMVNFYDKVLDDYPEVDKSQAINNMLDFIAQGDIVSVKPPESEHVSKDSVDREIDKNVRYLLSFTATGVRRAIADLYREEKIPTKLEEFVQQPAAETPEPQPTPPPKPTRPAIIPKVQ